MPRFEEIQMKIAESAKNYLDVYNMQVFIEQFTLDRESKLYLALPDMEPPFPVASIVSFTYDAFQTGMTIYEEDSDEQSHDIDTSIDLDVTIKLPIMKKEPDVEALLNEIEEEYPDAEPILISKDVYPPDDDTAPEYEISYNYNIEAEDISDSELLDEIFEEMGGIMRLVYDRTKDYIDYSWYRGEQ